MMTRIIDAAEYLDADKKAEMLRLNKVRSETLRIMYDNIEGVAKAQVETKNYIYDCLNRIIRGLV